ncbi:assimilatory sulfite reductase (NADPH) flavoprotein subunit [Alteribacillus bidgolensis]|uniref:assimilatory sulfite reductase (NADPH) n=1 Tax=Alteribacillus bidgolensis TaxID=930129 RepID=A0A1G8CQA3_9BACI|nr:assimilatory sulfite reductase (NADPH) flavoprotein subunit [Alteribacillus bidgolensis]SDH47701.1 sulfite reductase (NADPH) alpha subunit [Alteribacillus bidgolensis]
MQLLINNSPFSQEQTDLLNRVLPTLTEEQKIWLSGYLAANQTAAAPAAQNAAALQEAPQVLSQGAVQSVSKEITILYGSQTGNGQSIAEDASQKLKEQGFDVTLSSMDSFKPKTLKKIENLLVIVSTHGEGDPPDNALSFYEFLHGRRAPKLEELRYSVLALGDTSYEFFCQTGKDFDKRLEELGGERLHERVDCDVDFEESAEEWLDGVLGSLQEATKANAPANAPAPLQEEAVTAGAPSPYSRKNPFRAELLDNINLNGRGSNKETRHLELSLEGSGLEYEPGDSLGIYPENDPELVDKLLDEMSWDPDELITINKKGEQRSLREALISIYEITVLTKPLLEKAAPLSDNSSLQELVEKGNEDSLREYITGRDLLDLGRDFAPWNVPASEFVKILRKIPPRLYSIASSPTANPDEVHLTIGTVRYETHGRARTGVCSGQCAERTEPGDLLPVYIQKNPNFKLPEDTDTPIIMIGPGTGAAPFRAFLEEREETEAEGKTWMFFGDQHFRSDFIYQVEWQRWLKEGVLTKMDVAFSRDTAEKVYVQHRMLEKSEEFYNWLMEGAVVYVCGDEQYMASDVHEAIRTILQQEGGMSEQDADAYIEDMQQQKRYQRDVY